LCDALATALVVADDDGPELARSLPGYEAYIIRADGTESATEGIVFATEVVS
jgi:thiamine biosynthesis lipoprotein ApbE